MLVQVGLKLYTFSCTVAPRELHFTRLLAYQFIMFQGIGETGLSHAFERPSALRESAH